MKTIKIEAYVFSFLVFYEDVFFWCFRFSAAVPVVTAGGGRESPAAEPKKKKEEAEEDGVFPARPGARKCVCWMCGSCRT